MERPSNQVRWSGDPSTSDGRPWSFGKAVPVTAGDSPAGPSDWYMPGSYPISNRSNDSLVLELGYCSPIEEKRDDLGSNATNHLPAPKGPDKATEFIVDTENPHTGPEPAQLELGSFRRTSYPKLQYPAPVHYRNINNIRQPVAVRPSRLSNTWSGNGFVPETSVGNGGEVWCPLNSLNSRSMTWSDAFTTIRDSTIQPPSIFITPEGTNVRDFGWEQGSNRVATPDISTRLAACAYVEKTPGLLGCIFGAVKRLVLSCVGTRGKDHKPEHKRHIKTQGLPVDEFIVDIPKETENFRTPAQVEHTIYSFEEYNYRSGEDYFSEDGQTGSIQIGYQEETHIERPLSILLPPCPAFIAEEQPRPETSRPRSRPISYPGAPENEGLATLRREIELELAQVPRNIIEGVRSTDNDAESESDFDDYEMLRNGLVTTVKDTKTHSPSGIAVDQIKPEDHGICNSKPRKPNVGHRRRLTGLISPIMGAASSAVKTFLSSTLSSRAEEDGSGYTSTDNPRPSTPTLIRAAIGTSITNARKSPNNHRDEGNSTGDVDKPKEISNPKLSKIFGKDFYEEEIHPPTPESKGKYEYLKKELHLDLKGATVPEETEDSLWIFENGYSDEESFEEDETAGGTLSGGHQSRSEPSRDGGFYENSDQETLAEDTPEPDVDRDQSTRGFPRADDPGGGTVKDWVSEEDVNVDIKDCDYQLYYEDAFNSMFEDTAAFVAAHPDRDENTNGSESGLSDGSNDPDSYIGPVPFGIGDNIFSSVTSVVKHGESSTLSSATPAVEHVKNTIRTTSITTWTEAVKTLREDFHILGIDTSVDTPTGEVTWTSHHRSIVNFVEMTDTSFQLENNFFVEEDSENDSAKLVYNDRHDSLVYKELGNTVDVQVPSGMEHLSQFIRTVEVRQGHVNIQRTPTLSRNEHAGRISYNHLYDPDDMVASDEEDREAEREYKLYYEQQQRLHADQ